MEAGIVDLADHVLAQGYRICPSHTLSLVEMAVVHIEVVVRMDIAVLNKAVEEGMCSEASCSEASCLVEGFERAVAVAVAGSAAPLVPTWRRQHLEVHPLCFGRTGLGRVRVALVLVIQYTPVVEGNPPGCMGLGMATRLERT